MTTSKSERWEVRVPATVLSQPNKQWVTQENGSHTHVDRTKAFPFTSASAARKAASVWTGAVVVHVTPKGYVGERFFPGARAEWEAMKEELRIAKADLLEFAKKHSVLGDAVSKAWDASGYTRGNGMLLAEVVCQLRMQRDANEKELAKLKGTIEAAWAATGCARDNDIFLPDAIAQLRAKRDAGRGDPPQNDTQLASYARMCDAAAEALTRVTEQFGPEERREVLRHGLAEGVAHVRACVEGLMKRMEAEQIAHTHTKTAAADTIAKLTAERDHYRSQAVGFGEELHLVRAERDKLKALTESLNASRHTERDMLAGYLGHLMLAISGDRLLPDITEASINECMVMADRHRRMAASVDALGEARASVEYQAMLANLTAVQARCTELLEEARVARNRGVTAGGP